jgi:hypothetical protein
MYMVEYEWMRLLNTDGAQDSCVSLFIQTNKMSNEKTYQKFIQQPSFIISSMIGYIDQTTS